MSVQPSSARAAGRRRVTALAGSADRMHALGFELGRAILAADAAKAGLWIGLAGPLGAGKTVFAQGVARGLGVRSRVTSPTFVLVREHAAPGVRLLHADLYRLGGEREVLELGLVDAVAEGAVVLVEWPDRAESAAPEERLDVVIELARRDGGGAYVADAIDAAREAHNAADALDDLADTEARTVSLTCRGAGAEPGCDAVTDAVIQLVIGAVAHAAADA